MVRMDSTPSLTKGPIVKGHADSFYRLHRKLLSVEDGDKYTTAAKHSLMQNN
jgi:hypothetical protein